MFAERWTIDEVGDGVVRVLAARSLDPDVVAPLAEESRAVAEPEVAEEAGAEVMAIELGTGPDDAAAPDSEDPQAGWTEEEDSVLDEVAVTAFIATFRERVAGVVDRPLRETDVFWVVADRAPARSLSEQRVRRVETESVLAGYAQLSPVVRDMTAAARQASKVLYHDAFRKSEEQS